MEPERNCDLSVSWRLMWVLHTMQWHTEEIFLKLLENDFSTSWWPRVSIFLSTFLVSQRMTFVFSYQSLYHGWISPCSCMWWLQNSLSERLNTKIIKCHIKEQRCCEPHKRVWTKHEGLCPALLAQKQFLARKRGQPYVLSLQASLVYAHHIPCQSSEQTFCQAPTLQFPLAMNRGQEINLGLRMPRDTANIPNMSNFLFYVRLCKHV